MNSTNPSNPIITRKTIAAGVLAILGLILFLIVNPFSWNDAGNRTVVERTTGEQIVQFAPEYFMQASLPKKKNGQIRFQLPIRKRWPSWRLKITALK